ncbi:protein SKIP34 [Capsicum galapagoense]
MCYGCQRLPSKAELTDPTRRTLTSPPPPEAATDNAVVVENLRDRLAETEARLERARAREAELTRQLEEMKRFVCVMEILECYLKRRRSQTKCCGIVISTGMPLPFSHPMGIKTSNFLGFHSY